MEFMLKKFNSISDKGKLGVTQGRKATGQSTVSRATEEWKTIMS